MLRFRFLCTCGGWMTVVMLMVAASLSAADPPPSDPSRPPGSAAGIEFFQARIQPALVRYCFECHSGPGAKGGLALDTRRGLRKGGDSGSAVVAGNVADSLLMQAILRQGLEMPPAEPLPEAVIADFAQWIKLGAPDPRPDAGAPARHWSFQPRSQPRPPMASDPAARNWIRNPVDAFIWQKLAAAGLRPSPPADRQTLIRRLTFDLTGLPATPEDVLSFVSDRAPDAYERRVEQLLASPRYGEHWGRHWLDVVRYSETEGFEYDQHRPGAWRYRDYVIRSFNDDKQFDQFVLEQLGGDELDDKNPDYLVAAGFHRLGPVRRNAGNQNVAFSRNEVLTERTDAIGSTFLGLTVGCARCHDHRFDEIPQRDYYRLQAFLAASHENDVLLADESTRAGWQRRTEEVNREIRRLQASRGSVAPEAQREMDQKIAELRASLPEPLPTISSVRNDPQQRTEIHILRRGEGDLKGERVGPRVLTAFVGAEVPELPAEVERPRTQLARWLNDPDHPLTTRVYVNRIWQSHFGRGIVSTPNDFGANGSPPSHPELLDWLANEFVARGRLTKELHRLIVLSSTYRQSFSSPVEVTALSDDPENRLLWRFPRRRLTAEEVRDAMLATAGQLNLKMGGPSVMTPVEGDLVRLLYKPDQWSVAPDIREHHRRSIYLTAKRNLQLPFFQVLDQPNAQISCPRRETSTHALQALELLNGELANQLAGAFAERLERECDGDCELQIERAFLLVAQRRPTPQEADIARQFLATQRLSEFALTMFNLNAFIYVD